MTEKIFSSIKPVLAQVIDGDTLSVFSKRLTEQSCPKIMVYGLYNSGKSTLVNSLIKEELAAMGDVPTTDRVEEFDWNGCLLMDTPGIDAPLEHEQITRQSMEQSDIVIFVIASQGSFDEEKTYRNIAEIRKKGRGVFIVLNNKTGLEPDSPEYLSLASRLRENLEKHGGRGEIDYVPIVMLNACSALKARLEDKKKLLSHSRYMDFERTLNRFVQETASQSRKTALKADLLAMISKAQQLFAEQSGDNYYQELIKSEERVRQTYDKVKVDMYERIERTSVSLERSLNEAAAAGNVKGLSGICEQGLQRLEQVMETGMNSSLTYIRQSISDIAMDLQAVPAPIHADKTVFFDVEKCEKLAAINKQGNVFTEFIKEIDRLDIQEELTANLDSTALNHSYSNIIVELIKMIMDFFKSWASGKEKRKAAIRQADAVRDSIRRWLEQTKDVVGDAVDATLAGIFANIEQNLAENIHECKVDNAECRARIEELRLAEAEIVGKSVTGVEIPQKMSA